MVKVTISEGRKVINTVMYKNFQEANAAAFAMQRLSVLETIKVPVDKECVKEGQFTFKKIANPYYGKTIEVVANKSKFKKS
jgi:hypothetical protein